MIKRNAALIVGGLLLIAAALSLTIYNLYDEYRAGRSAEKAVVQIEQVRPEESAPAGSPDLSEESVVPDYVLNPDMEMPIQTIDGQDYIGVLSIPALDMELPIISEWSYPNLKIAPCRYHGSVYSGELVIAGHNYRSHFGPLKNLAEGDAVYFTDMAGNVFTYTVSLCEILNPTDVDKMTGGWDLSLFTCTLGGTYRETVRCSLNKT